MAKKVTMKQIAEKLDISINAVSIALNDRIGVSDEMRKNIFRTAEEMGYLDQSGKYNKAYSSMNICVIMRKIYYQDMHFYSKILYGIEKEANNSGYDVLIRFTDESEGIPSCIRNKKVVGIILVGVVEEEKIKELKEYNIPMVFVDHSSYEETADTVLIDNRIGGYKAVDYLMKQGFKKIGFFGELDYSHSIKERFWGYIEAIRRFPGTSGIKEMFEYADNYSVVSDVEQYVLAHDMNKIIERVKSVKELPEAFFCSNDNAAILLSNSLRTMGYSVPEDISMIGFDDNDLGIMVLPKLTTMHVGMKRMGMKSVQLLLWRLSNKGAPAEKILHAVELVERDSVRTRVCNE